MTKDSFTHVDVFFNSFMIFLKSLFFITFNTTNYLSPENFDKLKYFDVIIIGDLLYDDEISNDIKICLDKLLDEKNTSTRDVEILVGDPGRPYLENIATRLKLLDSFDLEEEFRCTNGLSSVDVYRYV